MRLLAVFPSLLLVLSAQTTTNFTLNFSGSTSEVQSSLITGGGTANITPFGIVGLSFNGTQPGDGGNGPIQGTLKFSGDRADSVTVSVTLPDPSGPATTSVNGTITGGEGVLAGATGSVTLAITRISHGRFNTSYTMTGSGNIAVGVLSSPVTITAANLVNNGYFTDNQVGNATGTVTPFGSATFNFNLFESPGVSQLKATIALNATDSVNMYAALRGDPGSNPFTLPVVVSGGTGAYVGATGSATLTVGSPTDTTFTVTGSGTVTTAAPGTKLPTITSVHTAWSDAPYIAQNTWIEIKGTNLSPVTTPAGGVFWSDAPEFASGKMPTKIGNVSVTVDGKPAYIWWHCSAATTSFCAADQINVLSPLTNSTGWVQVVVTNGTVSSDPYLVYMNQVSPSFLLFSTNGDIVAQHTNFSLLAPTGLFPGSTPGKKGEAAILYAIGLGLPSTPLVEGSKDQTGSLQTPPACLLGRTQATTTTVLVSPGLYAIVLTIPDAAISGTNLITCQLNLWSTQAGDLINVQ